MVHTNWCNGWEGPLVGATTVKVWSCELDWARGLIRSIRAVEHKCLVGVVGITDLYLYT